VAQADKKTSAFPIVVAAVFAVLMGWFILSHSRRPVEEVLVTVEATTTRLLPDKQVAERSAMIRLPDGRLMEARILTQDPVRAGQRAKIKITEDLLSGRRSYELIDVVAAQQ
jgi:hypothetical protein